MLKTPNFVSLVVFETLFGTLIVLQILRADSLSVNYAKFPKIAENQDWFKPVFLELKFWAKKWMISVSNLGKVSARNF